jgi:hypothetical protein
MTSASASAPVADLMLCFCFSAFKGRRAAEFALDTFKILCHILVLFLSASVRQVEERQRSLDEKRKRSISVSQTSSITTVPSTGARNFPHAE